MLSSTVSGPMLVTAATRRLLDEFQKESGIPVTFAGGERPFATPPGVPSA